MSIELENFGKETEGNENGQSPGLKRTIGLFGGSGIIVGTIIGSGIFLSPGLILQKADSVGLAFVVWTVSGIVSLLGGLCFAELGTAIPKSGAEYNYIMDSFGNVLAFLFLWTSVFIIKPASVTIIALTSALYIGEAIFNGFIVPELVVKLLGASIIICITLLNILSVKWAIRINNILNYMKILCILIIIGVGLYSLSIGGIKNFSNMFYVAEFDVGKFGSSLYSALWAYDGWNNLNYAAEEMIYPNKNLPRSIIVGMIIVIISYVLINFAFIAALGAEGVKSSSAVALTVANHYLGKGAFVIPILVACSAFGAANATIFANGRLLFVAGREGHLPLLISSIHNTFHTPVASLVLTAIVSLFMLVPSVDRLGDMIDFFSFALWAFFGLCFVAQIYFRLKRKDIIKPYTVFIAVPFFMALVSIALIVMPIVEKWMEAVIAFGIIIAGLPVYFIFIKFNNKLPSCFNRGITRLSEKLMFIYNLTPAQKEEDLG